MKKLLLFFGSGILPFGLGLSTHFELISLSEPALKERLTDIFPKELPNWQIHDQDMAESPESSTRIADRLTCDDAPFKVFKRGDTFVGLYVADWMPGKLPYCRVGVHTPDTCWNLNSWSFTESENKIFFDYGAAEFEPAEFGVYEKDGNAQNVYLWHLIGGQSFNYKQEGMPSILGALIDIKEYGLDLKQEQFSTRLSSNKSIEELKQTPGFNEILVAPEGRYQVVVTAKESDLS